MALFCSCYLDKIFSFLLFFTAKASTPKLDDRFWVGRDCIHQRFVPWRGDNRVLLSLWTGALPKTSARRIAKCVCRGRWHLCNSSTLICSSSLHSSTKCWRLLQSLACFTKFWSPSWSLCGILWGKYYNITKKYCLMQVCYPLANLDRNTSCSSSFPSGSLEHQGENLGGWASNKQQFGWNNHYLSILFLLINASHLLQKDGILASKMPARSQVTPSIGSLKPSKMNSTRIRFTWISCTPVTHLTHDDMPMLSSISDWSELSKTSIQPMTQWPTWETSLTIPDFEWFFTWTAAINNLFLSSINGYLN